MDVYGCVWLSMDVYVCMDVYGYGAGAGEMADMYGYVWMCKGVALATDCNCFIIALHLLLKKPCACFSPPSPPNVDWVGGV